MTALCTGKGGMIYGNVFVFDLNLLRDRNQRAETQDVLQRHYKKNRGCPIFDMGAKGFFQSIIDPDLGSGCRALIQLAGLGRLQPNTVLLGYKHSWADVSTDKLDTYVNILRDAFMVRLGVASHTRTAAVVVVVVAAQSRVRSTRISFTGGTGCNQDTH